MTISERKARYLNRLTPILVRFRGNNRPFPYMRPDTRDGWFCFGVGMQRYGDTPRLAYLAWLACITVAAGPHKAQYLPKVENMTCDEERFFEERISMERSLAVLDVVPTSRRDAYGTHPTLPPIPESEFAQARDARWRKWFKGIWK